MKQWDAVVIGAGNGGLAAAATLAKAGKRTLLLERHSVPGGFATSFRRGRFEFEASLHEMCGFGRTPGQGNVRVLFDSLGISDRIDWVDVPSAFHVITRNDEKNLDAAMPFGVEAFIDKMEWYVPGSRAGMRALFDLAEDISNTTAFLGGLQGNYSLDAAKAILKEHLNFVRVASYDSNTVLRALGVPQRAIDIFNTYWCYLGADCDTLSFIHYISMVHSYLTYGAVVPKGRSHEMSSTLLERFEELGGEVWLNTHVNEILLQDGKVCGVCLENGEVLHTQHVISNVSQHNVFGKMILPEDVPEWEIKKANAREFAMRGFALFLGLNRSHEELGIKDHCYMIYDTIDTRRQYELSKSIETNNVQATVCPNVADPDCSAPGTSILYFTRTYAEDAWGSVKAEDYEDTKRRVAGKMIADFEAALGTNIREHIEEIAIATPMTYARYTDTPQGVIYGYYASKWDGIVPRIMMAGMDEKVPGLRFAGGFGTQLLGYSTSLMSGSNAANDTLRDMEAAK